MTWPLMGLTCLLAAVVPAVAVPAAPVAAAGGHPQAPIVAVGAENEYANVISQVGGKYVSVTAVMSNPNTDPHTFEASPSVARAVARAQLVVQNGLGYDSFMGKIEAAAPSRSRRVIDVQSLLRLPSSTLNPHLWYKPSTMPAVAAKVAADLETMQPAHAATFRANLRSFDQSLQPWRSALAQLKSSFPHFAVATTEPVADYLLEAAGADIRTPWSLQADIMNGIDPSPEDVATEEQLLDHHEVKMFVYNRQVTDSATQTFLSRAQGDHIPVVGVYETMPVPGYDYQSWMLAEVHALEKALHGRSTTRL